MTGLPLPQCRSSVERAYDGNGEPFDCVNPRFFEKPEPMRPGLRPSTCATCRPQRLGACACALPQPAALAASASGRMSSFAAPCPRRPGPRRAPAGPRSAARTGTPPGRAAPSSPSPSGRVAVAVRAQRRLRSRSRGGSRSALHPDDRGRSRRSPRRARRRCARRSPTRQQVAGVEAEPSRSVAAGQLDQLGQLLEGAAERVARARRVLEQQRAQPSVSASASPDRAPDALERLGRGARRPWSPGGARRRRAPIASPTRSEWISDASDFSRISLSLDAQLMR